MTILNPIDIYYCYKKNKYEQLSIEEQQRVFGELIEKGTPFFAGRIGMNETRSMRYLTFGYKDKYPSSLKQLCECAGFFPEDVSLLERYKQIEIEALSNVDFLLRLNGRGENYLIKKYCRKDVKFSNALGGWGVDKPWTKALKGRKVLVIHPFANTIEEQYKKREFLFPANPDILPEFELHTIKAVQTIAGQKDERFENWFEALDYMKSEIDRVDFDVALIGCGAYGFPLASYCKNIGKIAVHIGGDLQMLFGILGARWENYDITRKLVNEYWVRPDAGDIPKEAKIVENGCYW